MTARRMGAVVLGIACALALGVRSAHAAPRRDPSARVWATALCTRFVDFQVAALDARDRALPAARATITDRAQVRAQAETIRTAMLIPHARINSLRNRLASRPVRTRHGAKLATATGRALAPVAAAYARAERNARNLASAPPGAFPRRASTLLARLDRSLTAATPRLTKVERIVRRTPVPGLMAGEPACRRVGLEWAGLPGADASGNASTPAPPPMPTDAPGYDDTQAPSILLPHRMRPSGEVAGLAARTTMTPLGRTFFYAADPTVESGPAFASDCPTPDGSMLLILGCYRDHRIYIPSVSRPELAPVVNVSAAHEMLHAVYEGLDSAQHAQLDPLLSRFYETSADDRLRRSIAAYGGPTARNALNELHSLIPTEQGALSPELAIYAAGYFRDRRSVVRDYVAYVSVFERLLDRYNAITAELDGLRGQITSVRNNLAAASGDAQRLGNQIDSLRSQGRIAESNALVPAQNDAARRSQALAAQGNDLVTRYNQLIEELNGVVAQVGDLRSALRPIS